MTVFEDTRAHPIKGMVQNPEWDFVLTRRAELYLAERARRAEPDHEPTNVKWALAVLAVIGVAVSLAGALL